MVSEDALVAALANKWIRAAYLDVFAVEPLPSSSKLWDTPGVTITPHVASVSFTSDVMEVFEDNFRRLIQAGAFSGQHGPLAPRQLESLATLVRHPVDFEKKY